MTTSSRVCIKMSDDHLFPKQLSIIDRNGKSPYYSVILLAVVSLFLSIFDFKQLVEIEIIFDLSAYFILPFVLWKLRKMYPVKNRNESLFIIGGGNLGAKFIGFIPIIVALIVLFLQDNEMILFYIIALYVCVILYIIFKYIYGGSKHIERKYFGYNIEKNDIKRILIYALSLLLFACISFMID